MKLSVRRAPETGFNLWHANQLDLSSLSKFVSAGETSLADLRAEISRLKEQTFQPGVLRDLAGRFGRLSHDADVWSFDQLYRLGFQVQVSLLDLASSGLNSRQGFVQVLEEVTSVISSLLSECEKDYRHRIQVFQLLESISQPARGSS